MNFVRVYPSPINLKKNELKTLHFIYTNSFLNISFPELAHSAKLCYFNLNEPQKLKKSNFSFKSKFEISIQGKDHILVVGANIRDREIKRNEYIYDTASYSILICSTENSICRVLRRMHFDYADPLVKNREIVPTFHLQYGGKFPSHLLDVECDDSQLHSWLSLPRLNHHPLTLAILLDIVFCEFRSEETHKIVERSEWRHLVKENEELVVEPYYKKVNQFILSANYTSECLIRDFCYGN